MEGLAIVCDVTMLECYMGTSTWRTRTFGRVFEARINHAIICAPFLIDTCEHRYRNVKACAPAAKRNVVNVFPSGCVKRFWQRFSFASWPTS